MSIEFDKEKNIYPIKLTAGDFTYQLNVTATSKEEALKLIRESIAKIINDINEELKAK